MLLLLLLLLLLVYSSLSNLQSFDARQSSHKVWKKWKSFCFCSCWVKPTLSISTMGPWTNKLGCYWNNILKCTKLFTDSCFFALSLFNIMERSLYQDYCFWSRGCCGNRGCQPPRFCWFGDLQKSKLSRNFAWPTIKLLPKCTLLPKKNFVERTQTKS